MSTRTKKINMQSKSSTNKTLKEIESLIVNLSYSKNILDKITTGLGWSQNLDALVIHNLMNHTVSLEIREIHDFLLKVNNRYEVPVYEWNFYAKKTRWAINHLQQIV